jgi:hypothetical protein
MEESKIVLEVIEKSSTQHTSTPVSDNWKNAFCAVLESILHVEFTSIYGINYACDLYPTPFVIER